MIWFVLTILLILSWLICGLYALVLHQPASDTIPTSLLKWVAEPGNSIRVMLWIGALAVTTISWASPPNTLLGQMLPDFISISIAIIIIDELVQYRNALQEKQRIILQMASHSNDFALNGVQQVRARGWFADGSLRGVLLSYANLAGAQLGRSDLREAQLGRAVLAGASLRHANLSRAYLVKANLTKARMTAVKLQKAQLGRANLSDADLVGADLSNADLKYAVLDRANLERVDLRGCDLKHTSLVDVNFKAAKYDLNTIWPQGFDPKAVGATEIVASRVTS